jgi:DNA invertase Pin-like site-specific DNA recombinase
MSETKPIKVAIYSRVSTGHQDDDLQVSELRSYCTQRGWAVVAEYADTISGSKEGPERRRMLADAHKGGFSQVLVWRFDRFGRSARDLLLALDALTALGVGFSSLRESFDTGTPVGGATVTILSAVAELEKNTIKERVHAGLDRARSRGVKLGRPEREVDVAKIIELVNEGRTQRQIAVAMKVPRTTVRRALAKLTGEAYCRYSHRNTGPLSAG